MTVWGSHLDPGIDKLAQAFMEQHPRCILDIQSGRYPDDDLAAFEQGSGPDIVQVTGSNQVAVLCDPGYLVDLSREPIASKIPGSRLAAANPGAAVYAIPVDLSAIGILYNKKIFSQHGLLPPKKYSELQTLCADLRLLGITPFAPLMKENWHSGHFIAMVHAELIGGDAGVDSWASGFDSGVISFAQPVDTARLFSILDSYKANWPSSPETYALSEQYNAFADGTCAMMVQGPWAYINWMSSAAARANRINDCGILPALADIGASAHNEPLAVIEDGMKNAAWGYFLGTKTGDEAIAYIDASRP